MPKLAPVGVGWFAVLLTGADGWPLVNEGPGRADKIDWYAEVTDRDDMPLGL